MAWAPDYIEPATLATYAGGAADSTDPMLAVAISAASRAVDKHCRRQFGNLDAAEARYYRAHWSIHRRTWVVAVDDLMDATDLAVDVDDDTGTYPGAITSYRLLPSNAAADGEPWTHIAVPDDGTYVPDDTPDAVRVTALWGWTDIPQQVVQATLIQAHRFYSRRESPYGVTGSPDAGGELRLLSRLDPDVAVSLTGVRRSKAAVG